MPIISSTKYLTKAGWDDVPHISEEEKKKHIEATPAYLLPARMRGEPVRGVGRIYPYDIDQYLSENPFRNLPDSWPRCFALDPAWNLTAALWAAHDEHSDTVHLYSEYYASKLAPALHTAAIKTRGDWVPGCADPAARKFVNPDDGVKLMRMYEQAGLHLELADNAVQAGLQEVESRITTGRLKVYRTLRSFAFEYGQYARDDKGAIIKRGDHLMDAMRYICMTGIHIARCRPAGSGRGRMIYSSGGVVDSVAGF